MKRFLSVLFILSFIGFCEALAQPDLTFVGTTPSISTQPGKIIIDLLSVINVGSSGTNQCQGNILVDGALNQAFLIPSLAALGSAPANQKQFTFTIPSIPGPHTVEIRLDVNNQNSESNEGNNDASRSVTVPFFQVVTITVTKSGSGSGTVTSSEGMNCGANCSSSVGDVREGTTITLKALASSNSAFKGWSNGTGSAVACNNSTSAICRFTLSQDSVIRANFQLN